MAEGYMWIVDKINEKKYTRYAELGIQAGLCAARVLYKCPSIDYFLAVDLWQPQPSIQGTSGQNFVGWTHDNNYKRFLYRMEGLRDRVTIEIIKDYTHNAVQKVKEDGFFDLIFIDANHSYENCREDILDWMKKVRIGGILCGHDYEWPGVHKAVCELIPEHQLGGNPRVRTKPIKGIGMTTWGQGTIWYIEITKEVLSNVYRMEESNVDNCVS